MLVNHEYVCVFPGVPLKLIRYPDKTHFKPDDATHHWILQLQVGSEELYIFVHCYLYGAKPKAGELKLINLSVLDFVNKGRGLE